jgi:hypothetical protein
LKVTGVGHQSQADNSLSVTWLKIKHLAQARARCRKGLTLVRTGQGPQRLHCLETKARTIPCWPRTISATHLAQRSRLQASLNWPRNSTTADSGDGHGETDHINPLTLHLGDQLPTN